MVAFPPPPPTRPVSPIHVNIPQGAVLVRIFDPTRRGTTALSFRNFGPILRFDHHRGLTPTGAACDDPERAVYYAAWSGDLSQAFSSCVVECFGDTGVVETANRLVAIPTVERPLHLLDLRDHGAMRAGTFPIVAKCEHRLAQPWSRHFYDEVAIYQQVDGIMYRNAHNEEPALLLYERAQDALTCAESAIIPLSHPRLQHQLNLVMLRNNLILHP